MLQWLSAFLVTQMVECPLYAYALKQRSRRWVLAASLSAITHPVVFWIFPRFDWGGYWQMVSLAECFAVSVEAACLSCLGVRHSILWSVCANALSVGIGLALRALYGWP